MSPSPGRLVIITVGGRRIPVQVIAAPPGVSLLWWLVIDVDGQLYDRQPGEAWEPLPRHLSGNIRQHTDAQFRRDVIQKRIALMFDPQAIIRLPRKPRETRGPDKAWAAMATKNRHGKLAPGDVPQNLAYWGSSRLSPPFEARIVWSWDTERRRQMRDAMEQLSARQAAAFRWCLLGGQPWTDEEGRVLTCPMQPWQLARAWGVTRQAVHYYLRQAFAKLTDILSWDPRDYVHPRPDPVEMGPVDVDKGVAC